MCVLHNVGFMSSSRWKICYVLLNCFRLMDCCSDRNITEFESPLYRIESDRTLLIKKERLQRESREQCGFCCMFTGAAIGTSVSIATSHGSTLPVDVPGLVVSGSSAAMCAHSAIHKQNGANDIGQELARRKDISVTYVDNESNLSVYSEKTGSLSRVYCPDMLSNF